MATTTPNFGWAVPTSTDLVKDGAVAIETLGDSIDASLIDLKGGTTGQVLAKATNTDMDFSWITPSSGGASFVGCSLWKSPAQTLSNATDTILTFENEEFDTNTFHSTVTNTSRITIPTGYAGKYLISATIAFAGSATGNRKIYFFKNGGTLSLASVFDNAGADATRNTTSAIANLAVGDYIEVSCQQNSGGNLDVNAGQSSTRFSIVYLGA